MTKVAFVTGVSGQDGPYLCKYLLDKGYKVVGGDRANASGSLWRLDYLGIQAVSREDVRWSLQSQANQLVKIESLESESIS